MIHKIKNTFIYILVLLLFIICMPVSWYIAYTLGGVGSLVFSLIMPTYGESMLLVYSFLGHGFWQTMLAYPVAFVGAGLSLTVFSWLMEKSKPSEHKQRFYQYKKEIEDCRDWFGLGFSEIEAPLKQLFSIKNIKNCKLQHDEKPNITVLKAVLSITKEAFLYSGEAYSKPTARGCLLLDGYSETLNKLQESGWMSKKDKLKNKADIMRNFKALYG